MDRLFKREGKDQFKYNTKEKLLIGFSGMERFAGVTTLALSFSKYLVESRRTKTAIVELGRGNIYDSIGADKRFAGRDFFRFYGALESNEAIKGKSNVDEGINYVIRTPYEKNIELAYENKVKLITQTKGDVIICDFSGDEKEDLSMLCMMDFRVIVIDPMPSKMLSGYEKLCRIRSLDNKNKNSIYIVNKFNKGVNARQMNDFLTLKNSVVVPFLSQEFFYRAEYNCKAPYSILEIHNCFEQTFEKLSTYMGI